MDLPSRAKWYEYSRARDAMLKATDTRRRPWYIVRSDDKNRARLNTIAHLLKPIPHKKIERPKVKLPNRSRKHAYDDEATLARRRVRARDLLTSRRGTDADRPSTQASRRLAGWGGVSSCASRSCAEAWPARQTPPAPATPSPVAALLTRDAVQRDRHLRLLQPADRPLQGPRPRPSSRRSERLAPARALDDLVAQADHGARRRCDRSKAARSSASDRGSSSALTPPDVDELSGETVEGVAAQVGRASAAGARRSRRGAQPARAAPLRRARPRRARHRRAGVVGHRAAPTGRSPGSSSPPPRRQSPSRGSPISPRCAARICRPRAPASRRRRWSAWTSSSSTPC